MTGPDPMGQVLSIVEKAPALSAMVDRMAEAICRQMREDIGRAHDWRKEPEKHRVAFRRAAAAAFLAQGGPDRKP